MHSCFESFASYVKTSPLTVTHALDSRDGNNVTSLLQVRMNWSASSSEQAPYMKNYLR